MARIIHPLFISSTFDDLREERAEVQKAALKLGFFPVGMELFPSADDETWEFIKRQIDECDYYLVIVAGRYGSLAADGLSFTQKEWEYARQIGKPSIAFLHADPGKISAEKTEIDPHKRKLLAEFTDKLKLRPISTYRTPHELAVQAISSLVDLKDRHPQPGFVRASETVEAKKYADALEEIAKLTEAIARHAVATIFPEANEEWDVTVELNLKEGKPESPVETHVALGAFFMSIAESLLAGRALDGTLSMALTPWLFPAIDGARRILEFDELKNRLFGLGLITYDQEHYTEDSFGGRMRFSGVRMYWKLTPYGQQQFGLLQQRELAMNRS